MTHSPGIAIITGSASGLGAALVAEALRRQYHVLATDISDPPCVRHPTLAVEFVQGDVAEPATVSALTDALGASSGQIHLFNNIGRFSVGHFETMSPEEMHRLFQVNTIGPLALTLAVYREMLCRGGGAIVNILSNSLHNLREGHSIYNASKAAIQAFSAVLRAEARPKGIRVMSVYPGGMRTNFYERTGLPANFEHYMDPRRVAACIMNSLEQDGLYTPELVIIPDYE
ncbi:MAG: SDR family NAD(P)-dependent oxidoreductase [Egibacteraceae bacterium]